MESEGIYQHVISGTGTRTNSRDHYFHDVANAEITKKLTRESLTNFNIWLLNFLCGKLSITKTKEKIVMKKLMVTAAIVISSITISFAQQDKTREQKTPEERAQTITNHMEKKLALTSEQKEKVYQINLERAKNMTEFRNEQMEYRKKQIETRKTLLEQSDNKISAVLTDAQQKTYTDLKADTKENMKERMGDRKEDRKGRGHNNHREKSSN